MELTKEQKKQLINERLSMYSAQIFKLEMDKVALEVNLDVAGANDIGKRIDALKKASAAVQGMI